MLYQSKDQQQLYSLAQDYKLAALNVSDTGNADAGKQSLWLHYVIANDKHVACGRNNRQSFGPATSHSLGNWKSENKTDPRTHRRTHLNRTPQDHTYDIHLLFWLFFSFLFLSFNSAAPSLASAGFIISCSASPHHASASTRLIAGRQHSRLFYASLTLCVQHISTAGLQQHWSYMLCCKYHMFWVSTCAGALQP